MNVYFGFIMLSLDLIISQFIYSNLTTTDSVFSLYVNNKDNKMTLNYNSNSISQMNQRQKYCLNTPVTNKFGCSVIDINCCFMEVVHILNNTKISQCVPMGLEATTLYLSSTGEKNKTLSFTQYSLEYQSYSTVLENFNIFINCQTNIIYKTVTNDTYLFSTLPINTARYACLKTDPTNNFYKCRRYANNCCYVKSVYPNNTIINMCIPIDNTSIATVVNPSSSTPLIYILKEYQKTNNDFSVMINNVNYNFFCNEDVLLAVSNNTSINTYKSIFKGNYTFDSNDLNCMNWNMKSDLNICRNRNIKGNCCYYYFYPDSRDNTKIVSGCMAFIHPTSSLNFTLSFREGNSNYDVNINCPKLIT